MTDGVTLNGRPRNRRELPVRGALVGNYRLIEQIGEGGMGTVYRAEHTTLARRVAVKVLLPEHSQNPTTLDRFFTEAKAASSIDHPGIVEIYDVGLDGDSAYIVMELLEGESLQARLERVERLAAAEAVEIAAQIASVLAAAHAQHIVHRDLKPDNVFLSPDPDGGGERAILLDFGVAKLMDDVAPEERHTRQGMLLGTPAYMSPEQCRGSTSVDHRADLYSLGCIMFRMVSGQVPFRAPYPADVLAAHLRDPPPALRELAPDVPAPLEQLIERLLAKVPEARGDSAAALCQELERMGLDAPLRRHSRLRLALVVPLVVAAAAMVWLAAMGDGLEARSDDAAFRRHLRALANPATAKLAMARLEQLADPRSIGPIAKEWRRQGRPALLLEGLIQISRTSGHWSAAVPALADATEVDPRDGASIDRAVTAAAALGESRLRAAIPPLVRLAGMDGLGHPVQKARVAAVVALGSFREDPRAVDALLGILRDGYAKHGREPFVAAIEALGRLRSPRAVRPIVAELIRHPDWLDSARLALVRIGSPATSVMIDLLGDRDAIATAARVLGDLRAEAAVPSLIEVLASHPSLEASEAVIDALARIGDPRGAKPLLELALDSRVDRRRRATALREYAWLARDGQGMDAFEKLIRDGPRERLFLVAAQAYGRLATRPEQLALLRARAAELAAFRAGFESSIVAAGLGVRCGARLSCYVAALGRGAGEVAAEHAPGREPTALEKLVWHEASLDRALLEIARRGQRARSAVGPVLALVDSPSPAVRGRALHALLQVAQRPCAPCVARLDEVLGKLPPTGGRMRDLIGRATLAVDTRIARELLARPR